MFSSFFFVVFLLPFSFFFFLLLGLWKPATGLVVEAETAAAVFVFPDADLDQGKEQEKKSGQELEAML